MPSASSSTVQPSVSQRPSSSPQPRPTVPLPSRSPGWIVASCVTYSMICSNEKCILPSTPSDQVSPSTRAASRAWSRSNSSGVAMQGPIELAKSFPIPGPMPTLISRSWMSRALQSL